MELTHAIVIGLLLALVIATGLWWRLYRRLGPDPRRQGRDYRVQQLLVALIATLAILVSVLIVLSSDPGSSDDILFWP